MEQAVYHIHAHLTVFVDRPGEPGAAGDERALRGLLHTHASEGIIHIESPGGLARLRDADPVGDLSRLHAQIQLEVGRPLIAPEHVSLPNGL